MRETQVEIPDLPSARAIDRLVSALEPLSRITRPKVYGIDALPAGGSLLVGNHTIYGFLDLPFMMAEIWKRRRLAIRGLGEHAHYAVPIWRDLLAVGGRLVWRPTKLMDRCVAAGCTRPGTKYPR